MHDLINSISITLLTLCQALTFLTLQIKINSTQAQIQEAKVQIKKLSAELSNQFISLGYFWFFLKRTYR